MVSHKFARGSKCWVYSRRFVVQIRNTFNLDASHFFFISTICWTPFKTNVFVREKFYVPVVEKNVQKGLKNAGGSTKMLIHYIHFISIPKLLILSEIPLNRLLSNLHLRLRLLTPPLSTLHLTSDSVSTIITWSDLNHP